MQVDLTSEKAELPPFALITAFRFFLNAEDELRAAVMVKLASLLDNGGALIFNNHMNKWSLHALLVRLYKFATFDKRKDFNALSNREVEALVRVAGLVVVKKYHYGFLPVLKEHTWIPMTLIRGLERILSRVKIFNGISTCVIYVCQRKEDV